MSIMKILWLGFVKRISGPSALCRSPRSRKFVAQSLGRLFKGGRSLVVWFDILRRKP